MSSPLSPWSLPLSSSCDKVVAVATRWPGNGRTKNGCMNCSNASLFAGWCRQNMMARSQMTSSYISRVTFESRLPSKAMAMESFCEACRKFMSAPAVCCAARPSVVVPIRSRKVPNSCGKYFFTTMPMDESFTVNRWPRATVAASIKRFGRLSVPGSELLRVSVKWFSSRSSSAFSFARTCSAPRIEALKSGPVSSSSPTADSKWCSASTLMQERTSCRTELWETFSTSSNTVEMRLAARSPLSFSQQACRMR
mmetsp:Transcript_62304/g.166619  ORF Transcript_62304/g.166619 Transcript_62304/m.166619 type:complete len:253 (+) Transcript_62304:309-1067(+)